MNLSKGKFQRNIIVFIILFLTLNILAEDTKSDSFYYNKNKYIFTLPLNWKIETDRVINRKNNAFKEIVLCSFSKKLKMQWFISTVKNHYPEFIIKSSINGMKRSFSKQSPETLILNGKEIHGYYFITKNKFWEKGDEDFEKYVVVGKFVLNNSIIDCFIYFNNPNSLELNIALKILKNLKSGKE